ncbi:MAG: signal peptide peptidase SppA [Myxococcales bacterium]|nr:signal peptide peptidase SppA [Myxococcales bacterium]
MRRLMGLIVLLFSMSLVAAWLMSRGPAIPDSSILVLEISGRFVGGPPADSLSRLLAPGPSLVTLLLQLDKARADDRVDGVLVHIRPLELGYASIQELRRSLQRVRDAGKQVIALLDLSSLNATREYYLASVSNLVYVVPGYQGAFAGISGQYLFLGGLFEKLGIEIEYERIGEYKSAPESFAETGMSPAARRNLNQVLDTLFAQIVAGVADGRELEPALVRALIEEAPGSGAEFLAAGLADGVAGREEVLEAAGLGDAHELDLATYARIDPTSIGLRNGPKVALIFGSGTIVQGAAGRGFDTEDFSSDRVAKSLRAAAEDDAVRAIVLRVDSPGGSALASDQVWRAIASAREAKPVVISMGDAAASGGYYVSSAADAIVAEPATVTGSIGVFVIRPALEGLYQKLGIGTELFVRGKYAALAASPGTLKPFESERLEQLVRSIYDEFLERVSTGRGLELEEVDELGRGRIWLGSEALEVGLVDELGGLYTAVERAKREARIEPEIDPARVIFPGPRSVAEQIRSLLQGELLLELAGRWFPAQLRLGEIPSALRDLASSAPGEPSFLPPHWIQLR